MKTEDISTDLPGSRKMHSVPTPKIGGIAIVFGLLPLFFLLDSRNTELVAIIAASLLLFVVGLLDDIFHVSAKLRFLLQLVVALLMVRYGICLSIMPDTSLAGYAVNVGLTLLWLIGITNAFNFLDGINGEASGLAVIIGAVLALYALSTGQIVEGMALVVVVGATGGFMPYNLKRRAEVFLGDGGSVLLGFFLAAMSIQLTWGPQPALTNLLLPVIVFAICIYDMCLTTITRIYTGKVSNFTEWLVYAGKDHIHHRLVDLFGDRLLAVTFIYTVAASNAVFPALFVIYAGTSEWFVTAAFFQTLLTYLMITLMLPRKKQQSADDSGSN